MSTNVDKALCRDGFIAYFQSRGWKARQYARTGEFEHMGALCWSEPPGKWNLNHGTRTAEYRAMFVMDPQKLGVDERALRRAWNLLNREAQELLRKKRAADLQSIDNTVCDLLSLDDDGVAWVSEEGEGIGIGKAEWLSFTLRMQVEEMPRPTED